MQRGSLEWRQELAALIIQLAWRQYQRRKILHMSIRRQRVLHEWSPSILASRQRALADKVYGEYIDTVFVQQNTWTTYIIHDCTCTCPLCAGRWYEAENWIILLPLMVSLFAEIALFSFWPKN